MPRYTSEIADRRHTLLPLEEIAALLETAHLAVVEMCNGKRTWTMHIPPETTDQDMLLSDAIRQAYLLLSEVKLLRADKEELQQIREDLEYRVQILTPIDGIGLRD